MYQETSELLLYSNLGEDSILLKLAEVYRDWEARSCDRSTLIHRIYVENIPVHITAGELKKLQSDEAARGKKIASGKIQDFFTWLEAQDIGTQKDAFIEALDAMRQQTRTVETKKAINALRDYFG